MLIISNEKQPIYPPETAWMREPKTDISGLIVNDKAGKGRVVYMPADLDHQYGRYNLPDQGDLSIHHSTYNFTQHNQK